MLVLAGVYSAVLLLFLALVVYVCLAKEPPSRPLVSLLLVECVLILLHTLVFAVSILLL